MSKKTARETPDDYEFIYRPWITTRDGRRIYAKACGKVAFKIRVKRE